MGVLHVVGSMGASTRELRLSVGVVGVGVVEVVEPVVTVRLKRFLRGNPQEEALLELASTNTSTSPPPPPPLFHSFSARSTRSVSPGRTSVCAGSLVLDAGATWLTGCLLDCEEEGLPDWEVDDLPEGKLDDLPDWEAEGLSG